MQPVGEGLQKAERTGENDPGSEAVMLCCVSMF